MEPPRLTPRGDIEKNARGDIEKNARGDRPYYVMPRSSEVSLLGDYSEFNAGYTL
jgi:hypothetical protein